MTIPAWALPLLLTIAVWAWGIFWPSEPSHGDYDFGPSISAAFRFVVCVIGTLVFWLAFFMAKSGGFA